MPRNKYPEETIQKILDAALKVFNEKGYEKASVLDIVAEMGDLTRGAFYHHFKNKEEVLLALNEKLFLDIDPFVKVKEHTELNGLQKIQWLVATMNTNKTFVAMQYELETIFTSPACIKMQIDSIRDTMTPLLCELIEEGNADGSLHVPHPKLATEAMFLLSSLWSIDTLFPCSSSEEVQAKIEMIADLCEHLGIPIMDEALKTTVLENNAYLRLPEF